MSITGTGAARAAYAAGGHDMVIKPKPLLLPLRNSAISGSRSKRGKKGSLTRLTSSPTSSGKVSIVLSHNTGTDMSTPGLVVMRDLGVCQHCSDLSDLTVRIEMTLPYGL